LATDFGPTTKAKEAPKALTPLEDEPSWLAEEEAKWRWRWVDHK
jgi:hypothetical protein